MKAFLQAIFIGLAIAIPIDEMYFLCIKKTLERGIKAAFLIGLGITVADCLMVSIPLLNLPFLQNFFTTKTSAIQYTSGLFLILIGLLEFRKDTTYLIDLPHSGNISLILKSFFMELTNPVDIAVLLNIYHLIHADTTLGFMQIVAGVFVSIFTWWIFLGFMITRYKHLIPEKYLRWIKLLTSIALVSIGLIIILSS